ncbi:MAG: diphthine synthase [Thermoprotei archaeon]
MLFIAGMGIGGPGNLTLSLLEAVRSSQMVFAEVYTNPEDILTLRRVEELTGKRVVLLTRKDLEEKGAAEVLEVSKKGVVSLLVFGDPFIFTTHLALKRKAEELGIEVRVVHGISVLSLAPSCSGLDPYRFGPPVTVVFPDERYGYFPETTYEVIAENLSRDLHTLVLLDVRHEEGRYMGFSEAINILEMLEEKLGKGIMEKGRPLVLLSALGSPRERVSWVHVGQAIDDTKYSLPKSIIVPASIRFYEAGPPGLRVKDPKGK